MARGLFPDGPPLSPWRSWIVAGIWIGLAGLSKYHAALFGVGVIAYLISSRSERKQLTHPAPWIGAGIALAIVSPVII